MTFRQELQLNKDYPSMIESNVWESYGRDTMSRNSFYGLLGLVLTWGFGLTYLVSQETAAWQPGIGVFLLVGLVVPIIGIIISSSSDNAAISFIGFNMVVVPFGAMLGPVLAHYNVTDPGVVGQAAMATAMVTGVMTVTGFLFPQFYSKLGGALFMALLGLLAVRILQLFIPSLQSLGIVDYLAAGLFALYIGYDMWRASEIAATADNAVDVAVSLYLDIYNLFLNLLRIFASSND